MKILFAASEAAPYIKTGGLGDVAQALPEQLSTFKENEVCVFIPYYKSIKNNPDFNITYITNFSVPLAWRNIYCGLFKAEPKKGRGKKKPQGVTYYFIDNEYYFCRNNCYGFTDDGERFAFFSKAILESLQHIGFYPDIIHCNDWQTGFVPLFLKAFYMRMNEFKKIKTVYTIHNIEYQGIAEPSFLTEVLGVGEEYRNIATFDHCINAMKTAIVLCDKLTTVSPTYSYEIRYAYFAHNLENILNENSYKLSGIVNGINTNIFNPEKDPKIYVNYNSEDISKKAENKRQLQMELGLDIREDVPLIAIVSRLVSHKGIDLVEQVINNIANMDIQLVILGTGNHEYEDTFKFYSYNYRNKICAKIMFDATLANKFYAASDFFLMPSKSEPCGLSQIIAMRYGSIPIVRETGGLVDTVAPLNIMTLEGRGFTFKSYNAGDMLDAINRAMNFYHDKEKMNKVVKSLMEINFDWQQSANDYMNLYRQL